MPDREITVVHVDTEKGWGGGQNQVLLLMQELLSRGRRNILLTSENGELWVRSFPLSKIHPALFRIESVTQANQADIRDFPCALKVLKEIMDLSRGELSKGSKTSRGRDVIIHLHSWRGILFALLLSKYSGYPLVVTRRINRRLGSFSTLLLNRFRFRMVSISESVKKSLQESGFQKKISVVHSGIITENFSTGSGWLFREMLGLREEDILIGHVGAFNGIKGQEYLMDAISVLSERDVRVKAAFVGEGNELPALKKRAEMRGLKQKVFFLGEQKNIKDFLASVDIMAVPSLVEGLGIAAIEAMAAGIPVVAFKTGGLAEVVEDGVTGFLTPGGNVLALAERLMQLAGDEKLRTSMGEEAKKKANRDFSYRKMVDAYEKIYYEEIAMMSQGENNG
ncbi:MAG: glycosyltransferase family 4 protein [Acidobacteriota bacterium]